MAGPRARMGGGIAALMVVALTAMPASASASGSATTGRAVTENVDSSAAGVRSYWTSARMRAAQPVGLANSAPAATAQPAAHRARIATLLSHIRGHPERTAGKVFFSAGLFDYECSGTAVKAPSRSLVITAGHCGYFLVPTVRHWTFVPAYDHGKAPFGKWAANQIAAPAGWANASQPPMALSGEPTGGDSRFDVSAATVGRLHGRTLQSVVGGRRIAIRQPRRQEYEAIGYPAEAPFDGAQEYGCSSGYRGSDRSLGSPAPISITCDMTGGSSGGGWLDSRGRLVSVTSYGYSNQPDALYGPYFGRAIGDFYRSVRSG